MLTLAPVFRIGGHYRPLLVELTSRSWWHCKAVVVGLML